MNLERLLSRPAAPSPPVAQWGRGGLCGLPLRFSGQAWGEEIHGEILRPEEERARTSGLLGTTPQAGPAAYPSGELGWSAD
jgi:hypothetical protein